MFVDDRGRTCVSLQLAALIILGAAGFGCVVAEIVIATVDWAIPL